MSIKGVSTWDENLRRGIVEQELVMRYVCSKIEYM
jgi:hypothetical protein